MTEELDLLAQNSVPHCDNHNSVREYFQIGADYIASAKQHKANKDYKNAYIELKCYLILITERLPQHSNIRKQEYLDEYDFNLKKCSKVSRELESLRTKIDGKKGYFSGWFGSSSTPTPAKTSPQNTTTLPSPPQKALPPPPRSAKNPETLEDKVMTTVIMNDKVQQKVGKEIAKMAKNEEVQAKVGSTVAVMAKNEKYQKQMGNLVAESTDNELVKMMARNEQVQKNVSTIVAKTAGNKEVQKKVGETVHTLATDREVQKKVAKGVVTVGKGAWVGSKFLGKVAYSAYTSSNK